MEGIETFVDIAQVHESSARRPSLKWLYVKLEPIIWWPALVYDNFQDLQYSIPSNLFNIKMELSVLKNSCPGSASQPWAVLLGKKRPVKRLVFTIPRKIEDKAVQDFFTHADAMKQRFGSNENWCQAYSESVAYEQSLRPISSFTEIAKLEEGCARRSTWVRVDVNSGKRGRNPCIWWPALLYDSHEELQKCVPSNFQSIIKVIQDSEDKHSEDCAKIAMLLGENRPVNSMICIIPKDREEKMTKDYFNNEDAMIRQNGKDESWDQAHKELNSLMESYLESEYKIEVRGDIAMSDEIDLGKEFPSLFDKDRPFKENSNAEQPELQEVSFNTKKKFTDEHTASFDLDTKKELSPDPKTQEAKEARKATPSPPDGAKKRTKNKGDFKRRAIPKDAAFRTVMEILRQDYGWHYVKGNGLHDYYYVSPQCGKVTTSHIQKKLTKHRDYFVEEEEFQGYVNRRYGWVGPKGNGNFQQKDFGKEDELSLRDRVKKRLR